MGRRPRLDLLLRRQPAHHSRVCRSDGGTDRARRGKVLVTRTEDGKEKKIYVDVKEILGGGQRDFALQAFDVVFVPESIL